MTIRSVTPLTLEVGNDLRGESSAANPPHSQSANSPDHKEVVHASDLLLKTDLHLPPALIQSYKEGNKCELLIWFTVFVVSIVVFVWQLGDCVVCYMDNPILTTYAVVVPQHGVPFPYVYLCPPTLLHRSTWERFNVSDTWEQEHAIGLFHVAGNETGLDGLMKRMATHTDALGRGRGGEKFDPVSRPTVAIDWQPEDVQDYFLTLGYPVDTFLHQCSFDSLPVNCSDITTPVFDSAYGKCFLLNLTGMEQVRTNVGLRLIINTDRDNAYFTRAEDTAEAEADTEPVPPPLSDAVLLWTGLDFNAGVRPTTHVAPGHKAHGVLHRKWMRLMDRTGMWAWLSQPQRCVDEQDAAHLLQMFKGPYDTSLCHKDCIYTVLSSVCQCLLPVDKAFLQNVHEYDVCTVEQLSTCVYGTAYKKHIGSIQGCRRKCIAPCEYQHFDISMSYGTFPSKVYQAPDNSQSDKPRIIDGGGIHIYPNDYDALYDYPESVCELPVPDDDCALPEPSHYYDAAGGVCVRNELGCPSFGFGLRNSFATMAACENQCGSGIRCFGTEPHGDSVKCTESPVAQHYYYSYYSERCEKVDYYGCARTGNQFDTIEQCETTCRNVSQEHRCLQLSLYGHPCENVATVTRYYVDLRESGAVCVEFESYGCDETENAFDTQLQCEEECVVPAASGSAALNETNGQCVARWPLAASDFPGGHSCTPTKYFFDPRTGQCAPFNPNECGDHGGNYFDTMQQCGEACKQYSYGEEPATVTRVKRESELDDVQTDGNDEDDSAQNEPHYGDLIVLDLAFNELQYIKITQADSMTLSTFIGNVGGQLGLWLGASIVSAVKFFVLLAFMCCSCKKA